uniref:Uncharacterized protein n=1 Tax=Timspurckia oligopyrenoides TaxID=708627 RepID=A0A7S1EPC3_9RHOD|mmetsp:Transcript_10403/g.18756  ORF Transcript_10403/g.18756 Transcript_10403/m.18756 type:complete len:694 (+) Transcript_10403:169-2250(+)|eukprot:CAMPEP_0182448142 /NCGR_PEP_ID=MMETSP1172-20130603/24244_1 /TAXON_ID=708627 /ORGANISM="Timspurckia oligopyrenoides, Strain CCMP3278" /LENGTH=693 /DNA_ID=CAMNT_0024644903 /DNA_START=83 /DNA_END=2164 /DNA_ORIENTATION=-
MEGFIGGLLYTKERCWCVGFDSGVVGSTSSSCRNRSNKYVRDPQLIRVKNEGRKGNSSRIQVRAVAGDPGLFGNYKRKTMPASPRTVAALAIAVCAAYIDALKSIYVRMVSYDDLVEQPYYYQQAPNSHWNRRTNVTYTETPSESAYSSKWTADTHYEDTKIDEYPSTGISSSHQTVLEDRWARRSSVDDIKEQYSYSDMVESLFGDSNKSSGSVARGMQTGMDSFSGRSELSEVAEEPACHSEVAKYLGHFEMLRKTLEQARGSLDNGDHYEVNMIQNAEEMLEELRLGLVCLSVQLDVLRQIELASSKISSYFESVSQLVNVTNPLGELLEYLTNLMHQIDNSVQTLSTGAQEVSNSASIGYSSEHSLDDAEEAAVVHVVLRLRNELDLLIQDLTLLQSSPTSYSSTLGQRQRLFEYIGAQGPAASFRLKNCSQYAADTISMVVSSRSATMSSIIAKISASVEDIVRTLQAKEEMMNQSSMRDQFYTGMYDQLDRTRARSRGRSMRLYATETPAEGSNDGERISDGEDEFDSTSIDELEKRRIRRRKDRLRKKILSDREQNGSDDFDPDFISDEVLDSEVSEIALEAVNLKLIAQQEMLKATVARAQLGIDTQSLISEPGQSLDILKKEMSVGQSELQAGLARAEAEAAPAEKLAKRKEAALADVLATIESDEQLQQQLTQKLETLLKSAS